eukprot:TRINITY_DN45740_c0_g1_i1.p1 TRINITY_DN45740_c0_g1~~TRINITY_DN45740_c0_g1_i1.p1  ORF type:complete len:526 (+),score=147.31 TRINITY_DN45740_c0_g1_i1:95-1579(+)
MLGSEGRRIMHVGGVEQWMDEAYVNSSFAAHGPVLNVKVVRDRSSGNTHGYAFVEFADSAAPERLFAEQVEGKPFRSLNGTIFRLNWALYGNGLVRAEKTDASVYVGNLDPDTRDGHLYQAFGEAYGSVVGARVCVDSLTGSCRGFGFVRFRDPEEAERAVTEMSGVTVNRRPIRVRHADKPKWHSNGTSLPQMNASPEAATVHVLNVSDIAEGTTETELAQNYSVFGAVLRAKIVPGGRGIVEFRDYDSCLRAQRHMSQVQQQQDFLLQQQQQHLQHMQLQQQLSLLQPGQQQLLLQMQQQQQQQIQQQQMPQQQPQLLPLPMPPPPMPQDGMSVEGSAAAGASGSEGCRPQITNMTTFQAQNQMLQSECEAEQLDCNAVNAAAEAWARGLQGVLPLNLAMFQSYLENPSFVESVEKLLAAAEPSSRNDGRRGSSDGLPRSWLLVDQPELFVGKACAEAMNKDFVPTVGSMRPGGAFGYASPCPGSLAPMDIN